MHDLLIFLLTLDLAILFWGELVDRICVTILVY